MWSEDACQFVGFVLFTVPVRPVGAAGAVVIAFDAADAGPVPAAFVVVIVAV